MSSPISVGDVIAICTLAYQLWNRCKSSVEEHRDLAREVISIHIILTSIREYWEEQQLRGLELPHKDKDRLADLTSSTKEVLEDLEKLLEKYARLGKRAKLVDRIKWAPKDVSPIRNRLMSRATLLSYFNSTITASSVAERQDKILEILRQQYTEHQIRKKTPHIVTPAKAATSAKPDMIVSIDFGMTSTAVAYVNLTTTPDRINTIYSWPGRRHLAIDKVPSSLTYSGMWPVTPVAWGFNTALSQKMPDCVTRVLFKTLLDPIELMKEQQVNPEDAPSMDHVEKWYEDYLRALYANIHETLAPKLSGKTWFNSTIQFLFTIPVTWVGTTIVEDFKAIIGRVGFQISARHSFEILLNEASAAAAHVFSVDRHLFKETDVLLMCDAGGTTVALSVHRVQSIMNDRLSLEPLLSAVDINTGSSLIDIRFSALVEARLREAVHQRAIALSDSDILTISDAAMDSDDFSSTKCSFGSPDVEHLEAFDVAIPWLPPNHSDNRLNIANQIVRLQRSEIQQMFDEQVDALCHLIDSQLNQMHQISPGQEVTHLILSGGLGQSAYVVSRLKARYEFGGPLKTANISNLRVRLVPNPRLSVCMGMCEDRLRSLNLS